MRGLDEADRIAEQVRFLLHAGELSAERMEVHLRDLRTALRDIRDEVGDELPEQLELKDGRGRPVVLQFRKPALPRGVGRFSVVDGGLS